MKVFNLVHQVARNGVSNFAQIAPEGWRVVFSEPKRRDIQNDKIHAIIGDIAKSCEFMGQKWHQDDWKRLLIDAFAKAMRQAGTPLRHDGRVVPSLDHKGIVQLGIQSREFTVKEASEFIEYLYSYSAENNVELSQ